MEKLISFLAPKSILDTIIKAFIFQLMIVSTDIIVEISLYGIESLRFPEQIYIVMFVGAPFTIFAFYLLSHQHHMQLKLANLAATDMLTGLPNRRAFITEATRHHENGDPGAILVLDADYFKRVNDTFGHAVGDVCLQAIADLIRSNVRSSDITGRLGGEEFAIYLLQADRVQAEQIGKRLSEGIQLSHDIHGAEVVLTMSVGATLIDTQASLDELISSADEALYRAKESGRARIVFSDPTAPKHHDAA